MKSGTKIKKQKPKRPLSKVLKTVTQVLNITHIPDEESIWTWGEAGSNALPDTIDIVVWNIWKESGGDQFFREFQNILQSKHLILAQEALLTLKALNAFIPSGFVASHGATYRRSDGVRDGVMTISSAKTYGKSQRVLCMFPEPILKTTKASLITSYKIADRDQVLCVVNTHATLLRRPSMAVRELEQVIDQIAHHEGPLIYAGDFNTFSKIYIKEADRALASIGLKRLVIDGDPRTATTALDQVYVRGIEVVNARVDTTFVHSDHFPILVKMKILPQ